MPTSLGCNLLAAWKAASLLPAKLEHQCRRPNSSGHTHHATSSILNAYRSQLPNPHGRDSRANQADSSTKPQVFHVSPAPVALPWPSSRPPSSLRLLGLPDTVVTTSDKLGRRNCNRSAQLGQLHWGAIC